MMMAAVMLTIGAVAAAVGGDGYDAGEMLPLLKRHEIQVLLAAGFTPTQVAERAEVSVDTVRRVKSEPAVSHVDDASERRARGIGRPSKAAPFAERVREWLAEEPDLPTQELLRRAKEAGFAGRKSAFYSLVAGVRERRPSPPIVRFEGLPGEFSQHDFGQVDVRFVDGRTKRVHFFASRLKYSRFAAVTLVDDEKTETLVRTLVRHFVAFGGVPLLAVFDRPRTIVTKSGRGRRVEEFNATFAQVMLELGVGAEMCAPRSGNQKGAVEHLVKWVKNSFFKWQKFVDEADLEAKLAAWVDEVNHRTASRATGEIPETRRQQELERLRPVRLLPDELALRVPVFVGPTAEVMFEGVPYTMPPEAANIAGTAFVYTSRVRIVAGRHEAEHARRKPGDPPASLPEHRAAKLAAVHGGRAQLYEKREQLLRLGEDALTLLTALTHREPRRSSEQVERLHALFEEHGEEAMREALARVVQAGALTVSAVRDDLEASLSARAGVERQLDVPRAAQPRARGRAPSKRAHRAEQKGGRR